MRSSALLVLALGLCGSFCRGPSPSQTSLVHTERTSGQDLEIGADAPGVRAGFIRYQDLLAMPQVEVQSVDDINFKNGTDLSGIYLDTILQALGASGQNLISAVCDDKYEAHYTVAYRNLHHPLLILKINGKLQKDWPQGYGPYLISHPSFTSAFHVLSHPDEAQVPFGVIRLEVHSEPKALASIAPRGSFAQNAPQMSGFMIAEQNCLRCHNQGRLGGLKGNSSWQELADLAGKNPQYFEKYITQPQSENPAAKMPAYTGYDAETQHALTAYFQTFYLRANR